MILLWCNSRLKHRNLVTGPKQQSRAEQNILCIKYCIICSVSHHKKNNVEAPKKSEDGLKCGYQTCQKGRLKILDLLSVSKWRRRGLSGK